VSVGVQLGWVGGLFAVFGVDGILKKKDQIKINEIQNHLHYLFYDYI